MPSTRYDAVVFDLLTALIDSWSLWNEAAGSAENGLRWRRIYLRLTYEAGRYRPYETIVAEAAREAGLPADTADRLVGAWGNLPPWPETLDVTTQLAAWLPLGIATNCSQRLGRIAAARAGGPFAAVVTAEQVGFYKPRPEVYRAVLAELGVAPERTLFVAGSAADVPGAKAVGMPVFWHNRMGLAPIDGARPDFMEPSLRPLLDLVSGAE
jgi:2-haloalkanoic acid dehalogenase type II